MPDERTRYPKSKVQTKPPADPAVFIAPLTCSGLYVLSAQLERGQPPSLREALRSGSTLYIGNDGGVWATPDDGATGASRNDSLVTRQYYALAVDPSHRNRVIAGSQDNGTDQRTDSGGTDSVWFYEVRAVRADGYSLDDKRNALLPEERLGPDAELTPEELERNNLPDVLRRWGMRDEQERARARHRGVCELRLRLP